MRKFFTVALVVSVVFSTSAQIFNVSPLSEEMKAKFKELTESHFAGELSVDEFTRRADLALEIYKQEWFGNEYSAWESEIRKEFALDTFWMRNYELVLFELGLDANTYTLMLANMSARAWAGKMAEKYYEKLRYAVAEEVRPSVVAAHTQWLESMERDYEFAGELYSGLYGSLYRHMWSKDVDAQLYHRTVFYYECYLMALLAADEAAFWLDYSDG